MYQIRITPTSSRAEEPSRRIAENPEPTYATLLNPQPDKGVTIFARIAMVLNKRRPDIPFLVVGEGARAEQEDKETKRTTRTKDTDKETKRTGDFRFVRAGAGVGAGPHSARGGL